LQSWNKLPPSKPGGSLSEYKPLADEAGKTAKNTVAALGIVADELKAGYERIRKLF